MKKLKLLVSDYDQTLSRNDRTVSEKTRSMIKQIKAQGILFGVATGRKNDSITKALIEEGIYDDCDVIISANGAEIFDKKTSELEHFHWINKDTIVEINKHFVDQNIVYFLEYEDHIMTQRDNESVTRITEAMNQYIVYKELEDIDDIEYPKILFSVASESQSWMDDFLKKHPVIENAYGFSTHNEVYEFVDVRVSKFKALALYCERNGIEIDSVLSFGDSNNDIELIEKSGIGVAMSNATLEVKAVADVITLSNDEDGVYDYLYKRGIVK